MKYKIFILFSEMVSSKQLEKREGGRRGVGVEMGGGVVFFLSLMFSAEKSWFSSTLSGELQNFILILEMVSSKQLEKRGREGDGRGAGVFVFCRPVKRQSQSSL